MQRLLETGTSVDDLPKIAKYVTLGHCWGSGTPEGIVKTTKDNFGQRVEGIPWNEFSKTFQDAIILTRRINCDFIWIDFLCIVQGDTDDWGERSLRMEEIYSNSFRNIAATDSRRLSNGLFSMRLAWKRGSSFLEDRSLTPALSHEIKDASDVSNHRVVARSLLEDAHTYLSWNAMNGIHIAPLRRAWVFQERLLAPRTLHFYTSELIWECRSTLKCECRGLDAFNLEAREDRTSTYQMRIFEASSKSLFEGIFQGRVPHQAILDFWLTVVESYSSLHPTTESDRRHSPQSNVATRSTQRHIKTISNRPS